MGKEGFGVYCAPYRTFSAPDMLSGDLRLTDSASTTAGSHFLPLPGPDMYSGGAAYVVAIYVRMMCNHLFSGGAPCHCISFGFLTAVPPGHLDALVGRVCWKCSQFLCLTLTQWTCHHLRHLYPLHGSVAVSLEVSLPECCATTSI